MDKVVPEKIKLLITIIDRGNSDEITHIFRENGVMYSIVLLGKGTAESEILDYLGLGQTEKDIIISAGMENKVKKVLGILKEEFNLDKPGHGIAFTVPIKSIDSAHALEYIKSMLNVKGE